MLSLWRWLCSKLKGIILKLDIEKAFDKLNWSFLYNIMYHKGFKGKWLAWIRGCITSISYSVLLNGKPKRKITAKRGIGKGDPLSSFLFVVAMDYLSRILEEAHKMGSLKVLERSKVIYTYHTSFFL